MVKLGECCAVLYAVKCPGVLSAQMALVNTSVGCSAVRCHSSSALDVSSLSCGCKAVPHRGPQLCSCLLEVIVWVCGCYRCAVVQVAPESFGLSVADILNLPDKELNQIIGMKMVAAPYRDDSKRLRPNYKALQRIKGEAAAAEAMRQHKRQKQKHKDVERQQRRQQEQQQQRQQEAVEQAARQQNGQQQQQRPAKQQQQHAGNKRRFEQAHGHKPYGQQHRKQQQQQQKPLSEMTAEEKQAARLASYAKLTLKPSQQDRERGNAGGDGMQQMRKKHRAGGDEQQGQHKKKKEPQPQPAGRLAAVPVDKPLTKAQKKNLLRSLKRKEKKGAE